MHPYEKILRDGDEALARGDLDAFWKDVADDVVVHVAGRSSFAGDHKGKEAVQELFLRFMDALGGPENLQFETHDVLANDEHAVQLQTVRAEREGRTFEGRTVNVFHFRDGKISELWTIDDDQYAADAFYG